MSLYLRKHGALVKAITIFNELIKRLSINELQLITKKINEKYGNINDMNEEDKQDQISILKGNLFHILYILFININNNNEEEQTLKKLILNIITDDNKDKKCGCIQHDDPNDSIDLLLLDKILSLEYIMQFLTGKDYYRLSFCCVKIWLKLNEKDIMINNLYISSLSVSEIDINFVANYKKLIQISLNINVPMYYDSTKYNEIKSISSVKFINGLYKPQTNHIQAQSPTPHDCIGSFRKCISCVSQAMFQWSQIKSIYLINLYKLDLHDLCIIIKNTHILEHILFEKTSLIYNDNNNNNGFNLEYFHIKQLFSQTIGYQNDHSNDNNNNAFNYWKKLRKLSIINCGWTVIYFLLWFTRNKRITHFHFEDSDDHHYSDIAKVEFLSEKYIFNLLFTGFDNDEIFLLNLKMRYLSCDIMLAIINKCKNITQIEIDFGVYFDVDTSLQQRRQLSQTDLFVEIYYKLISNKDQLKQFIIHQPSYDCSLLPSDHLKNIIYSLQNITQYKIKSNKEIIINLYIYIYIQNDNKELQLISHQLTHFFNVFHSIWRNGKIWINLNLESDLIILHQHKNQGINKSLFINNLHLTYAGIKCLDGHIYTQSNSCIINLSKNKSCSCH